MFKFDTECALLRQIDECFPRRVASQGSYTLFYTTGSTPFTLDRWTFEPNTAVLWWSPVLPTATCDQSRSVSYYYATTFMSLDERGCSISYYKPWPDHEFDIVRPTDAISTSIIHSLYNYIKTPVCLVTQTLAHQKTVIRAVTQAGYTPQIVSVVLFHVIRSLGQTTPFIKGKILHTDAKPSSVTIIVPFSVRGHSPFNVQHTPVNHSVTVTAVLIQW